MIVQHVLLSVLIHDHSLTTGCVDVPMARQNCGAPVLRATVFAFLVEVGPIHCLSSTNNNMVFVTRGHKFFSCTTALANREKNVEVAAIFMHRCTFLHCIVLRRVAYNVVDLREVASNSNELTMILHYELLDAGPIAAECEIHGILFAVLKSVRIDQVVLFVLGEANRAVIGPGAGCKGLRGCNANL